MGSRSSNAERARKAIDAMKALGFSKKDTTPVLKNLLKIFGNNWEPIEDECYRALADAILDRNQDQDQDTTSAPAPTPDEAQEQEQEQEQEEPLCIATRGREREMEREKERPWVSSSLAVCGGGSHYSDDDDTTDVPRIKRHRTNQSAAAAADATMVTSPQTRASTRHLRNAMPSSATPHNWARQMTDQDFQQTAFLMDPKPEPDVDVDAPNPLDTSSAGAALPLALLPPHQNLPHTSEPTDIMVNNGKGSAVENMQETPFLDIDVASSTMGEVKMSLKCNVDPTKFRMPPLEAVFKMVEDKCLRSYKILPSEFSLGNLMSEICQCAVQLGSASSAGHSTEADGASNGRSSVSEPIASSVPFMKPISCKNGGSRKHKSAEESLVVEDSENAKQLPNLALAKLRPIHDVADISKGEERARISVVNEFGSEKCPPSFYYIRGNLVFQNAYVNISIARIGDEDCCADCFGNCLSAPIPCACARETGGEYAYTLEGLVRTKFLDECVSTNRFPDKHDKFFCKSCPLQSSRNQASPEPCRGHLVRKFIKECWSKCGCNMECGNRVVQRGIACNLQVFFTEEGKGWGLRTLDELPKGAFVCEYVGEVVTNTELHERTVQNMHNGRYTYSPLLDADWGSEGGVLKDEEALSLDATFYGNVGRFVNHRCYDANLVEIPIEVETPDHHYYHIALFTTKKVEAFEELTWDYGIDFDDDKHPVKAFECLCGSRYCRGSRRHHQRRQGKAVAA